MRVTYLSKLEGKTIYITRVRPECHPRIKDKKERMITSGKRERGNNKLIEPPLQPRADLKKTSQSVRWEKS